MNSAYSKANPLLNLECKISQWFPRQSFRASSLKVFDMLVHKFTSFVSSNIFLYFSLEHFSKKPRLSLT